MAMNRVLVLNKEAREAEGADPIRLGGKIGWFAGYIVGRSWHGYYLQRENSPRNLIFDGSLSPSCRQDATFQASTDLLALDDSMKAARVARLCLDAMCHPSPAQKRGEIPYNPSARMVANVVKGTPASAAAGPRPQSASRMQVEDIRRGS